MTKLPVTFNKKHYSFHDRIIFPIISNDNSILCLYQHYNNFISNFNSWDMFYIGVNNQIDNSYVPRYRLPNNNKSIKNKALPALLKLKRVE